ncbi:MAG: hypothetical protein GKR94_27205 [Gammaproteobacteria bacterium]|nr:hypothetical protein [Gammaproteobacteria bacterium]
MNLRDHNMRANIAETAARLIIEGGIRDYQLAKRKAAERLGVMDRGSLPTNIEIEEAVALYQRLFRAESQPQKLAELRQAAMEAMGFLAQFDPRLTGAVLVGTADEHSYVELHLFTDAPEEVAMFLLEHGIAFEHGEKRLRLSQDEQRYFPAYRFLAGDTPIELLIMPDRSRRQPPLSPITGKALRRLTLAKLRRFLAREAKTATE